MQVILGAVYGVVFLILLAAGAFFVVIGLRLVRAINELPARLVTAVENLTRECAAVRESLKNSKDESEKLRGSLLPFSESMNRTSSALLEVTKGFDRFDLMRSALESNSAVGKVVVEISDRVVKQLHASSEVVTVLCNALLRGTSVKTGGEKVPVEVIITGAPASPYVTEEDESGFSGMTDEQAAFNENLKKAKAAGLPVDELEQENVPSERVNKAEGA